MPDKYEDLTEQAKAGMAKTREGRAKLKALEDDYKKRMGVENSSNTETKDSNPLVAGPAETKDIIQNSNMVGQGHVKAAVKGGNHAANTASGALNVVGAVAGAQGDGETKGDLQNASDDIQDVKRDVNKQLKENPGKIPTPNEPGSDDGSENEPKLESGITTGSGDFGDEDSNKDKKKRSYSIWDAYHNKEIDEEGATYYTIDAIANYLKNMGRSIGNVGAQFTGGTIDNNQDESQWSQRTKALNAEEAQIAKEQMGGQASRQAEAEKLANVSRKLSNTSAAITNRVKQYAEQQARNSSNELMKQKWMALAANPGNLGTLESLGFGAVSMMLNSLGLN